MMPAAVSARGKLAVVLASKVPGLAELLGERAESLGIDVLPFTDAEVPRDKRFDTAEVVLGDPNLFSSVASCVPRLRWFQSTWAGVEKLQLPPFERGAPPFVVTRLGGVFGPHMAEYVIGRMVAHERQFELQHQNQRAALWEKLPYRPLGTLTLGILGTGSIGNDLARVARSAFNMRVWGYGRRRVLSSEDSPYERRFSAEENNLDALLQGSDYVVSILPHTPASTGLLTPELFSRFKPGSVFINVGRGNVCADADLLAALDKGPLSAAILDVFNQEPLPSSSPLWYHPKVTISPHVSAISFAADVVELFTKNLELHRQEKESEQTPQPGASKLLFQVDWETGY